MPTYNRVSGTDTRTNMPGRYGSRGYGKRKRYSRVASKTSIALRRPTARNQQRQLMSLSKSVSSLQKRAERMTTRINYTMSWDNNISANYFAQSLVQPQSWQSVFGESENVVESQRINITSVNIDWLLSPGRESAQIDYTVFLISARNNKVFQETLALTAFQNNPNGQQDYTDQPITFMNPKRFHVHKKWRVQTSGITTKVIASTVGDVNVVNSNKAPRRWIKLPFKRYIQNNANQESWKQVDDDDIPISCGLAIVAFNNNSALDIENPNFKGTALFSCWV